MKHFLVILICAISLSVSAQTTKPVYRKSSISKVATIDSALIYYNLGWDYYKLDSMGPARYYWEKAAYSYFGKTSSRQAALYRLGLMQQNAEGVDTNLNMALDYYKKAAASVNGKFGNPDAIKNIAAYYESGIVYEKNNAKALEWYLKAKQAGNQYVDEDILRVRAKLNER
ncbi:MAG: tetratricopeptide repeat protein [Chitinophagaceae bacterium]